MGVKPGLRSVLSRFGLRLTFESLLARSGQAGGTVGV